VCYEGTSGKPIGLVSNLFKLERAPNFHLFQFRVDYNPEVPSKGMRRSMLKEHDSLIGSIYQFDGMTLFLPFRLEKDVCDTDMYYNITRNIYIQHYTGVLRYGTCCQGIRQF